MANFKDAIFTNAGLNLIAEAVASKNRITYTRATLNNATDDEMANAVNLTVLSNEQLTADIDVTGRSTDQTSNKSSYTSQTTDQTANQPKDQVTISVSFDNNRLRQDINYTAVGWYAKSTTEDETLIAVTPSVRAETMQAGKDDQTTASLWLDLNIKIDSSADITLVPVGNDVTQNWVKATITASVYPLQQGNTKSITDLQNNKADKSNTYTKDDIDGMDKKNVKSASINGGAEILPDEAGKLELVVPDPDLSKYVSLKQLTETLKTKADITAIPDKTATEEGIKQAKEMAQTADTKAQSALDNKADKTTVEENLATKANQSDLEQTNAEVAKKANSEDVTNQINSKTSGTVVTAYDIASKNPTKETNSYTNYWLVDQGALGQFADQINQLKGRRQVDAQDFNNLTDTGTYYVSNPGANKPTGSWGNLLVSNGDGHRTSQLYFPDDNSAPWYRTLDEETWRDWVQLSTKSDVNNAVNSANAASSKVDTVLTNSYFRKQGMDQNGNAVEIRANAVKQTDGGYAFDIWNTDWTASKLKGVLDQLPSKANSADVYTKTEVDSKTSGTVITAYDIVSKTPTKETNSYTNKWLVDQNVLGQFADAINSINSTRTPLVYGTGGDDLFAFKTNQIRLYPGNGKTCKNLPPASNTQWFTVQYVFENPNGDGIAIFRSPANEVWTIGNNGGTYTTGWLRLANSNDINDLQNQIQQLRDNQFEVQTFTDATAAANWEAQKPGKRMAIVNS